MIIQLLFINPLLFLMVVAAIILAFSVHEYSHAQMADFLGDPTAKHQGRLTVNPLAHLDPIGTLLLLFVGFGWGKPVPFNPYNLRNQKIGPGLVGFAGPCSNLVMASAVGLLLRFVGISNPMLIAFFSIFVWINVSLGIFNLLPFPPLDGFHIFSALFPAWAKKIGDFSLRTGFISLFLVIIFMYYIGIPFICEPLFKLLTGLAAIF